jgi:hypothetical protein
VKRRKDWTMADSPLTHQKICPLLWEVRCYQPINDLFIAESRMRIASL